MLLEKEKGERLSQLSPAKIALLEKRLRGDLEGKTIKRIVPDQEHRYDPFPMTEMTEAQWTGRSEAYELGGQSAHGYAELFDSEVDLERFEKAFNRILQHHEMFRGIVRQDGQYQILKEAPYYKVRVIDMRDRPRAEVEQHLEAIRDKMRRDIFRGDKWPLFECVATLIDEKTTRVHLSIDLLITDVGSLQLVGRQLNELYDDPEADLGPPPELSYRDYNVAVAELRKGDLYTKSGKYWLDRVPSLPPAPEMAIVRSGNEIEHPYFQHRGHVIEEPVWSQFKARARAHGLTPDVTVTAAFAEVIGRFNKNSQFTLNILSFKRLPLHDQVYQICGNFGSTILLQVENHHGEPFVDRARRMHQQLMRDLDHWYFSGVSVLREINRRAGGRTGATMPVVMASTLNYSGGDEDKPSLLGRREESFWRKYMLGLYLQTPQVWLDHQVAEEEGALNLEWDSVEELFPDGMPQEMLDAYAGLLRRLALSDEAWTETDRSYLLPESYRQVMASYNATDAPVSNELLQGLFAKRAQENPGQTAVIAPDRSLSYQELDRLSNRVAAWVRSQGAKPNQLVAVVMDKGWQQLAGVLGVLKAGAAYLPIDPDAPQERLFYLLENAEVKVALTTEALASRLEWPPGIAAATVDGSVIAAASDQPLAAAQGPDDIAYVIYTSGSTGKPKGVVIDHRGAVNTILDINRRFGVGAKDRVLALSALSFDLSVYDVFGMLAAGGTVVVPAVRTTPDPQYWLDLVRDQGVTVWNSVPALLELVVEHAELHSQNLGKNLRLALLSGDWIPVTLPDRLRALAPEVEVISLGGATEASIWSIFYPIGEVDKTWKSIPYGRPLANQRFYVLNDIFDEKPVYVTGELFIGGIGLAKGYWRDEEKTRKSFVTHPTTGERLYRTGDLGRMLPNGNIEFLGRDDLQVKVRGFRVELGEIEAVLLQHPGVQTAVVVASGTSSEDRRLVAYIIPSEPEGVRAEDLAALAAESLPDYMVPVAYLDVDKLPLNVNGKVDRKALADPERVAREQQKRAYVAPRTATEEEVSRIFAKLLSLERVGAYDNFFNLGGTSLLVNQVVLRIYDTLGVELPLRTVFESPTVEELAAAVEQTAKDPGGSSGSDFMSHDALANEAVLDPSIG